MLMPLSYAKSGNKFNRRLWDKALALLRTVAIKSSQHSLAVVEKVSF